MPAGLGKGIFLKKRSSQVFYPFKAYPLYTIPLPRSGKGARINVVLLNLVIDDPVAYLQIAGGLQHIAMRMLQGVNEQFLFEARHRIVERQRRPAVPPGEFALTETVKYGIVIRKRRETPSRRGESNSEV